MLVHFNIYYPTKFGESIRVDPDEGGYVETVFHEGSVWKGFYNSNGSSLSFSVALIGADHSVKVLRAYSISAGDRVELFLQPGGRLNEVFRTKPFELLLRKEARERKMVRQGKVTFLLSCDPPAASLVPCITGSADRLGKWKEKKAIPMKRSGSDWMVRFNLQDLSEDFEYKFGLYDTRKERLVEFEEGENRKLEGPGATALIHGFASFQKKWRGAGINLPVSAIRTARCWGAGDLTSLKEFTNVASKAGFRMLQLLPLNDTIATYTNRDSYPYSGISTLALHPVLLDVQQLAKAKGIAFGAGTLARIEHLNSLPHIEFAAVVDLKLSALKVIFEKDQDTFRDDFDWFSFFDINREWLLPYAAFCYLRDKYGTPDPSHWESYRVYNEDRVQELASPDNEAYPQILFYYYLQYHLHLQLQDAVSYAHEKGIIIKGDLPIGVGRFSVDTWMYPQYFHLDKKAGAPPDYFTTEGQDWGFPTYNWEAMKHDCYAWWQNRLQVMERYFDALRIDHVIGLMRIWTIQQGGSSALGYFVPALALSAADLEMADPSIDPEALTGPAGDKNVILIKDGAGYHFSFNMRSTEMFSKLPSSRQHSLERLYHYYFGSMQQQLWRERGQEHLSFMRKATTMLLCAEDLGFVPPVTGSLLDANGILSLWIQRMSRDDGHNFSDLTKAPYLGVVTPSTHDMPGIADWWNDPDTSRKWFMDQVLELDEEAPEEITPAIAARIIYQHLESNAMWAVFLPHDILAMDENYIASCAKQRINDPSDNEHIWNYRMPWDCKQLAKDNSLLNTLKKLIRNAGR